MQGDLQLRIRLEGGAELLEATRLRYQALVGALGAFGWRQKLRRNLEVLGATVRDQRAVDEVLVLVQRKAVAEDWARGPVLVCADEVRALRERLRALVIRRRGEAALLVLDEDLAALEEEALQAPRFVLPKERWALACQLLPGTLPQVAQAASFGALTERLFTQPLEANRLPAPEAFEDFKEAWRGSLEALPALWKRLEGIDRTGGVSRALRRRSQRAPRFTEAERGQGPAALIHAQFWQTLSHLRMKHFLVDRLEPVAPRTEEVMRVFGWLVRWQVDAEARLEHPALEPARQALLELAARLRGAPASPRSPRPFARLHELARAADREPGDDDWLRLRDSLTLVLRAATGSLNRLPPVYRSLAPLPLSPPTPQTLAGLVMGLEATFSR